MSSKKVAGIIAKWTKGDATNLPLEQREKIAYLWKVIEVKKGFDFITEIGKELTKIEREKAGA